MTILRILSLCFVVLQLTRDVTGAIDNAALNKPANVSSSHRNAFSAENAVDGNRSTIIHTALGQSSAWWKVDLETLVQDTAVKIYFRTDNTERRDGVKLYTSTTPFSSYPGGQWCHTFTGSGMAVVSANCTGAWRYLLIYRNTYSSSDSRLGPLLDFAEVEVLVCSAETYGTDCTKACTSRQCVESSSSCDRYTGACSFQACKAGSRGTDCTEKCLTGTYGIVCNMSCDKRKCINPASACDHVFGQCFGGCKTGWNGNDCRQTCSDGTYGDNCNQLCSNRHCVTSSEGCDHVTGQCQEGCKPGRNGTDCTTECPKGTYGAHCMKDCSDRQCRTSSSPCDHETGQCPDGCLDGWRGSDCTSNETETTTQVSVDDTGNSSQNQTAVVAGTVSAVVVGILLLIIVGVIIWRRKREGSRRKETCDHVYYNTATSGVKVMEPGSKVSPKESLPEGDEEGHTYTTIDQGCSPGNPELMDKSKHINSVQGPDDYEPVMGRTYEKLSMSNDQGSEYTELERKYENIKTKNIYNK